jgi:hypothetical protein
MTVRLVLVVMLAGAGVSAAQFQRALSFGERIAGEKDFDGRFNFCRLVYDGNRNGGSWRTDFPAADINMSIRFSELTKTRVAFHPSGEPKHVLVRPTSPTLFNCPLVIMTAPGSAIFNAEEAAALRLYLAKGGFLWADDFWGTDQWAQWEYELRKVLPAFEHPIVEVPMDHPMLRAQFVVTEIPQIPNIGYFRRRGADGSSHQRQPRPRHGVDDAQHRHLRFVGARRRGRQLFLRVQPERVRRGHQCSPLRADALTAVRIQNWKRMPTSISLGSVALVIRRKLGDVITPDGVPRCT